MQHEKTFCVTPDHIFAGFRYLCKKKTAVQGLKKYFSLVKFSHTVFALPFALTGMVAATYYYSYELDWFSVLLIVLCMVFARNAAMGFNRYADRLIDAQNPRTQQREIPSGMIKPRQALWFVIINAVLFVAATWWLNLLCFVLSFPALALILGYSYTKRFTALSHLVLGLSLAVAPTGAFLAVSGAFRSLPFFLSGIVLLWTAGFDIIYALQDKDFDKNKGLFSIPARLGIKRALWLSEGFHLVVAALTIGMGIIYRLGIIYYIGAAIFIAMLVWQHILVNRKSQRSIGFAFGITNGMASLLYGMCSIADMVWLSGNYTV